MKTCFGRFIGGWTLGIGSLLAAVLLAQCGSSSTVKRTGNTGSGGRQRGDGSVWWSTGGSGNTGFGDASYDSSGFDTGMSSNTGGMLNINPIVVGIDGSVLKMACNPGALALSGTPQTVQCYVELPDGSHATDVVWNTDDTRVGSIGQDGVFRANGFVGGVVKITALIAGSTRVTIDYTVDVSIQSNTGGVSPTDIGKLIAGGNSDAQFNWLYPYDRTVFPRGLVPPVLQFAGACADSAYLKITLPHFTYEQASMGGSPLKVTFPDNVWKAAQLSTAGQDLMDVSVTKMCGGQVTGPKTEQWITAPGKLKGVVYYTTYRPNIEALRLIIGSTAQSLIPDCGAACHSVSANGEVLANSTGTFDLTSGAVPPPQMASPGDERFDYAGLTYDGNRALSIGTDPGRLDKAPSPGSSDLLDTSSGNVVKGGLPTYWTPSFSPDSKYVAYTNLDQGDGHLGVMNYNGTGFSGGRDVKVDNGKSLGWASFLPDSLGVVYHEGDRFSTAGTAELRLIQVNSSSEGTVNPLAALNGYLPDGTTSYLPYGIAEEGHRDYQPTVLPRPIGGYYWVIFPTRRAYGNTLSPGGAVCSGNSTCQAFLDSASCAADTQDMCKWVTNLGASAGAMERKKAWVAAIDIDHPSKADPSHPAFYLAGQSILADTNRPFVALPPCAPDGASCESGADCCSGFCRETSRAADGTPILQCVPAPPGACANLDEACVTAADCCDPTNLCIAGRCAIPTPVIF